MSWKLILKDAKKQPLKGVYSEWKEQIAEECFFQCVYCSIHESQFGGINNYHIDHFRPKSIFAELENDICNLFYSCPICNRFKSDDWPAEPDLKVASYPDPSKLNYSELFDTTQSFEIQGKYIASQYLVIRLFLNRSQLIMERREERRVEEVSVLMKEISVLLDRFVSEKKDYKGACEALRVLDEIKNNIYTLMEKRRKIRPYELKDIRKRD